MGSDRNQFCVLLRSVLSLVSLTISFSRQLFVLISVLCWGIQDLFSFFHFIFRPSGLLLYPLSPLYSFASPVNSPAQFIPKSHTILYQPGFFFLPLKQKKKGGSVGGFLSVFCLSLLAIFVVGWVDIL